MKIKKIHLYRIYVILLLIKGEIEFDLFGKKVAKMTKCLHSVLFFSARFTIFKYFV